MNAMSIRILFVMFILFLIHPYTSHSAKDQRIALVIGNSAYSSGPLKNPVNDATDMAAALKRAGFTVTLKKNANLQEMVEAIEAFGNNLKRGDVGLFYYAGHGVQVSSVNYLLPISTKINKESDVRFQAVDAGMVLAQMENANNGVNIVILDACRDNPFGKSFRSSSRGLAIVANAPSGTFISYSTGAGQVADDGEGENSPYTKALLENIAKPGLTINKVFMNVRSKVKRETGQVPWELSSLEGDFFFIPGSTKALADELDDENKKLEAEQRRLNEEKEFFTKKKTLDEKRQKIADEKEQLAAEQEALEQKKIKKGTTLALGITASKESAKKQDKESLYAVAYQTFKDGHYDKSRTEFKNFLAAYPNTEYAGNAQFWIGECYFFEKNYEQAILEYEKVAKNYPKGDKFPYALLKQGLSFLNLKDKTSAKLILQQVIKDFPNTNQARIARVKLQEIK